MFGEIKEVSWVSKIPLSKDRENNLSECFIDDLLDYFQRQKAPLNENYLGQNIKLDKLIVMEDVLGLANKSETFANSLTV